MQSGEMPLTVVGNLTDDPELRFTPGGDAVVHFTVASTPRVQRDGQWRDGETSFVRCQQWRQPAENVAESLGKGQRVLVWGVLRERKYETRQGEKRTSWELDVEAVGPDLRYATARPSRNPRQQGTGASTDRYASGRPSDDPWTSAPRAGHRDQGGPADAAYADAPPF